MHLCRSSYIPGYSLLENIFRASRVSFANQAIVHNRQMNFKRAFKLAGAALSIAQQQGYANLAEKIPAILEEITPEGE